MKGEKKLREESKRLDEQILEEGKELKANLIREYCIAPDTTVVNKPTVQRKSLVIMLCCVIGCLLIVGICLPIFLNNDKPVHYLKENEICSKTTLENIYEFVDVKVNEQNFTVTSPRVFQDSVSNDILYYRINVDAVTVFPYGNLYFVTNKNYILFDEEFESNCEWHNYDVKFNCQSSNIDTIPSVLVSGYLEYGQLQIYFTYTDIDLGETVTPINFLDSLFII